MVIERTYCELGEILQANLELVRVKQFIRAPDCGTTVMYQVKVHIGIRN